MRAAVIAALCAAGLGVAACGDDSSNDSANKPSGSADTSNVAETTTTDTAASGGAAKGVATAKERVDAARAVPTFKAPGPAFDAGKAKGKKVFIIANSLSLDFTKNLVEGEKEAFAAAGVKTTVADNKADVSETTRLIQQAVSQKVDAIIIQSQPTKLISAPLKSAKSAGIPVVQLFESDPQLPTPEQQAAGVVAQVTSCYSCIGRLMADWAIADSGGKLNAVTYWDSDVGVSTPINEGEKAEFAELCPDCKVDFKDILVSDWAKQIPTQTGTDLNAKPPYDYFIPNYDGMVSFMAPAVHAAGAQDRVKVVSYNADKAFMQMLAKGDVMSADLGSSVVWIGWSVGDQTLRVLTGEDPVKEEPVPLRLFDKENIGDVDLSQPETSWYGADFRSEYRKLWGIA